MAAEETLAAPVRSIVKWIDDEGLLPMLWERDPLTPLLFSLPSSCCCNEVVLST